MKISDYGRIGVLMGGYSSDREISLKSGNAILNALIASGADAVCLDIVFTDTSKISQFIKDADIDVAFIALHGKLGEDGIIQTILDELNIPYTGSGPQASKTALNKVSAQEIFKFHGVNVPASFAVERNNFGSPEDVLKDIKFTPAMVKPATEGSSIGVSKVNNQADLIAAVKKAFTYSDTVLVEEFVSGREFTVGILDNEPLPVIEIKSSSGIFDYTAKYTKGLTEYIVPADIPQIVAATLQSAALKCHRLLGCKDMSRVDFILRDGDLAYFVLEINTIPGFTETSLLPKAARQQGYNFQELCLKLLKLAYGKKKTDKIGASS